MIWSAVAFVEMHFVIKSLWVGGQTKVDLHLPISWLMPEHSRLKDWLDKRQPQPANLSFACRLKVSLALLVQKNAQRQFHGTAAIIQFMDGPNNTTYVRCRSVSVQLRSVQLSTSRRLRRWRWYWWGGVGDQKRREDADGVETIAISIFPSIHVIHRLTVYAILWGRQSLGWLSPR